LIEAKRPEPKPPRNPSANRAGFQGSVTGIACNERKEEEAMADNTSKRRASAAADKAAGTVKQAAGKLTGNKSLQTKGAAQKTKGKARATVAKADAKITRAVRKP
jgi:uncharacterized protein YjbJ (UPF0337 family)